MVLPFIRENGVCFRVKNGKVKKKKIIKKRGVSDANGYCRKEGQRGK